MFYIYMFINLINNKVYIGKTSDLNRRFKQHLKGNSCISYAIKKHTISNFYFHILHEVSNESYSYELEKYYIRHFNSNNKLYGYNIADGGDKPPKKQGKLSKNEIIEIRNYKIYCKNKSIPINYSYLESKFKIKKSLAKKILNYNLYKGIFPTEKTYKDIDNCLKKCILCLKYLPFNNFYNVKTKVGLSGRCIKCFRKKIKSKEKKL